MSHVIDAAPDAKEKQIRDINALRMAISCIDGLELVLMPGVVVGEDGLVYRDGEIVAKGKAHYRTWKDDHHGNLVGDWDLPEGMTTKEVGENAVAVIRLKPGSPEAKSNPGAYEVGVIPHLDPETGEVSYSLAHDFYCGGLGIEKFVGPTKIDHKRKTGSKSFAVEQAHGNVLLFYHMMCAKLSAQESGHDIEFFKETDGSYTIVVDKQDQGLLA